MKKIAYIIFVLLMVSTVAYADTVMLFPSHGGGALDLQGGGYHLWDIKGQPVVGTSFGGGYTVQFGGIYTVVQGGATTTTTTTTTTTSTTSTTTTTTTTTVPTTIPALEVNTDNGWITKTYLERQFDSTSNTMNYIIHYSRPSNFSSVDIWMLSTHYEEGFSEIDRANMEWSFIQHVSGSDIAIITPYITNSKQNYYFRVVPSYGSAKDIVSNASKLFDPYSNKPLNSRTVALVRILLEKGLNLITLPIVPTSKYTSINGNIDYSLPALMENQTVPGDDFYGWDGLKLVLSSKDASGNWTTGSNPSSQLIGIGNGFWMNSTLPKILSVVGFVPMHNFSDSILKGLNLIGFPYPIKEAAIQDIGFTSKSGDDFYYWDGTGLKLISNDGRPANFGWPTNTNLLLKLGKGNWFNAADPRQRSVSNPESRYR